PSRTPAAPTPVVFPYTTLFRSGADRAVAHHGAEDEQPARIHAPMVSAGGKPGLWVASHCCGVACACACACGYARARGCARDAARSEEHTSELQSRFDLVCRLLL